MELVFNDTNLGSDILSQVEVAADACIGEDKMNFEFNTHLMVTEFDKKMAGGRVKSLELSWSPICDEKESIEKIMLCVRDVTELKQLAAEASKQKRELEIIGEILSVNQEKFHEFIDNSRQFIRENESIIKQANAKELETVSLLFRNMHTIKGNSRTYGLLNLTNMIHETEQGYDELRKNPDAQWKPDTLLTQLQEASALIEEYAKINDVKLGRKGPGRRGRVEKFLLVEKVQISQSLKMLDAVDKTNISALRNAVRDVGNTLKLIGTERIRDVLAGILESMPSLAKELGKEPPAISIEDHGIAIRSQGSGLIKNVFMHIFRNSIDHGLEKAAARVAQGKTPVGNIRLEVSADKGQLLFKMHDDGRGLPLSLIRQRAIENKLMAEGEQCSAEELAQFILLPGFSTAEVVTEVSGRGVGMDAVKAFLKNEGGKLEIRFLDANATADFRPFEVVISLPEKFAMQVDG
jgi:two-component system chemotaxis sensor kinase CheA